MVISWGLSKKLLKGYFHQHMFHKFTFLTDYKVFLFLISLTFFMWWSGIAGASLYAIPSLILILFLKYMIIKGNYYQLLLRFYESLNSFIFKDRNRKWLIFALITQSFLWLIYVIFKYYSFNLFTLDAGYHSNILYNISNGNFFSSIFNMHNLGEHFTPSMSFIALFYMIIPSINWMMGFKILAYTTSMLILYLIIKDEFKENNKIWLITFIIAALWLFLYRPIINSVRYEFQASSLAPPFVLLSFFFLKKEKWILFLISMTCLLGFKEHLGSVWIGFGCYNIFKEPKNLSGYLLLAIGIISIYLIMFEFKSYFRGSTSGYNDFNLINPFKDISAKIFYFFIYLMMPLLFIPIIFWKNGIMAMPTIGINLISGIPQMYSSHYHYDDVSGTLLILSVIVSIKHINTENAFDTIKRYKQVQYCTVIWFGLFLYFLPYSNLRFIKMVIPQSKHLEIKKEITSINETTKNEMIAVQDVLGSHFYRKKIQAYKQGNNCANENIFYKNILPNPLPIYNYLILSKHVSQYGLTDYDKYINDLVNSNQFIKLKEFEFIDVFKRI